MSISQGGDQLCSCQEIMNQDAFLYEESPQLPASSFPNRRTRPNRLRIQPFSIEEIREEGEEGLSPNEEEKARKSFLQSLESMRRGSHHLHLNKDKDLSSYRLNMDSTGDTSL